MIGDLRGRDKGASRAAEALAAARYVAAAGLDPVVAPYFPVARVNPYQALLYRRAWQHGLAPVPLLGIHELDHVRPLLHLGIPLVFHLHWTSTVLAGATSEAAAEARITRFLNRLDRFRDEGGRLAWTVHNVLPHDCELPEQEAWLQQQIVDRADVVHVMSPDTRALTKPWFDIPEAKTVQVPHPSYLGAYPDTVGRDTARWELGLEPDEVVYVFLGAIQPYKGLTTLLDAFDEHADGSRPRRLVVAGAPGSGDDVQAFLDRCLLDSRVVVRAERIPDHEMQVYLRAADVAVLPYERSLNSGVLLLALSFGLPVVVPETLAGTGLLGDDYAATFRPGDAASMRVALAQAETLDRERARASALATAAAQDPDRLSEQFTVQLLAHLSQQRPPDRADATTAPR